MKRIKLNKILLCAIGISILSALVITFVSWLISLFSWGVIFAFNSLILLPIVYMLCETYVKNDCYDLEDLWEVLTEEDEEEDKKKDEINKISFDL